MAKTWLITGSSRGFGWELARAVLEDGDHVVATARRPEQLDDLIRQHGDRVESEVPDLVHSRRARVATVDAAGKERTRRRGRGRGRLGRRTGERGQEDPFRQRQGIDPDGRGGKRRGRRVRPIIRGVSRRARAGDEQEGGGDSDAM